MPRSCADSERLGRVKGIGRAWTMAEDKVLRLRVQACGNRWRDVVCCAKLRARSGAAARQRWMLLQRRSKFGHDVWRRTTSTTSSFPQLKRDAMTQPQEQQMADMPREDIGAAADAEVDTASAGGVERQVPRPSSTFRNVVREGIWPARDWKEGERFCSWDQALVQPCSRRCRRARERPRPGSKLDTLSTRWALHETSGQYDLFVCNFHQAEQKVRRQISREMKAAGEKPTASVISERVLARQFTVAERDALGLVFHPRDAAGKAVILNTLIAGRASRLFLGGTSAKAGGWISAREVGAWMGIRGRVWSAAERILKLDSLLYAAAADSIYAGMADCAMATARQAAKRVLRTRRLPSGNIRYGSFGAGAFDANFHALRRVHDVRANGAGGQGTRGRVSHEFAVERDAKRLQVVVETTQTKQGIREMASNAARLARAVDVCSVTGSCKWVSKARHSGRGQTWAGRQAAARRSMDVTARTIRRYAVKRRPAVFAIEQSDGICTHFPQVQRRFEACLCALPYKWTRYRTDAVRHGACHRRGRVWWIGEAVERWVDGPYQARW